MKDLLAAISGALVFFWLVVLAGAIWGGVSRVAKGSELFSPAELLAEGACFGGADFGFCVGLPAAILGAVAGQLSVSAPSHRLIARHPLKQRRPLLDLFADSLLFLVAVIVATAIACATGFVSFLMLLMVYPPGE